MFADIHIKLKKTYAQSFTNHLNSIDEDIQWNTEGNIDVDLPSISVDLESTEVRTERVLTFLDPWYIISNDGSIKTRLFMKK